VNSRGSDLQMTPAVAARLLELRGWTPEAIERLDLGFDGERVTFPVYDQSGERIGFTRYRPNGQPKMKADPGTARQLFPPPEGIADDELVGLLWLVEGEPDTVRMWSIGLPAVGVPGAQNWRDEWAPRFSGRHVRVLVCFDCDAAGRANAARTARALVAAGLDARVLDLDLDRDDGYDLSDFLERARTAGEREEARRILERCAEMVPEFSASEPTRAATAADPTPDVTQRRIEPWPAFRDATAPEQRYIVEGLIPAGSLVFIAGPPKKGKTWLGIGLALSITTGRPLFGEYSVLEARPVLYVALEGSRTGIRSRIGALTRGLGLDPETGVLDRLHLLYRPRPFDLSEPETAGWLQEQATGIDAALVIIDVLRGAARIRENEAADFARVREALDPMLAADCSVALLHHFGKLNETQQQRSPGERMAGTGAMYGALDVGLLITRSELGARRLRVEIEARDFAAPDALGVVILGDGSGENSGFTYTDTATLAIDPAAAEERDLAEEMEALYADGRWRTLKELASKKEGVGANKDDLRAALSEAGDRFVEVGGSQVGRHATARPWGTRKMLADLEAQKVAPGSEPPRATSAEKGVQLQVEQVAPPKGGKPEPPAPPTASGRAQVPEPPEPPAENEVARAAGEEER
jgi:hypothetical protein